MKLAQTNDKATPFAPAIILLMLLLFTGVIGFKMLDLLLHVVDISHPNFEDHIASVNLILGEINAFDKPTLMVFNKIDAYEAAPFDDTDLIAVRTEAHYSLEEWKSTWMSKIGKNSLFISALNKENLEDFRKRVYDAVREIHVKRFPYNHFLYPDYEEVIE